MFCNIFDAKIFKIGRGGGGEVRRLKKTKRIYYHDQDAFCITKITIFFINSIALVKKCEIKTAQTQKRQKNNFAVTLWEWNSELVLWTLVSINYSICGYFSKTKTRFFLNENRINEFVWFTTKFDKVHFFAWKPVS